MSLSSQLIYNTSDILVTDLDGAEILYEDGTRALLVQDEEGNLFIPTEGHLLINDSNGVLNNLDGEQQQQQQQQVVYYTQLEGEESQTDLQFVEYVDQEDENTREFLGNDLESGSCHYAMIEDGSIFLPQNEQLTVENSVKETKKIVDISQITGRNLITGQKITLDNYVKKTMGMNENTMAVMQENKVSTSSSVDTKIQTSNRKLIGRIVRIDKKTNTTQGAAKYSIIKKETMSADTFNYVSRMLIGLMSMDSVGKNLCDKSLKIKVVEKYQNRNKTVLRLCGFMLTTETGTWKFLPVKEIAGDDGYKSVAIEGFSDGDFYENPYFETTSLTMIINIDNNGRRTMRINLTPNSKTKTKCLLCHKNFSDEKQLDKHTSSNCNICGKCYAYPTHLKRHLTLHQQRDDCEQYHCGLCNTTLKNVAEFNVHLKTHAATRTFQCGVCGREFSRHSNLVRHVAIHKGGAAYQCEICGCTYNFVSSLTKHMVQKHITSNLNNGSMNVQQEYL